jgi:flagellar biosynthesis chaperone FliJ
LIALTQTGSGTGVARRLANVDTQAQSLQAILESTLVLAGTQLTQQANSLLQSGMSATQLSAQTPILVQQLNSQINQQTASAISSFASAFGGGTKPVTFQLAQPA